MDAVPLRRLELDERNEVAASRVVEEDVEPAEPLDRGADHALDVFLEGDVDAQELRLRATLADAGGDVLAGRSEVGDQHRRTFGCEPLRGRAADPRCRPGDQRHPPSEPRHADNRWRARKRSTRSAKTFGVSRKQPWPVAGSICTSLPASEAATARA